MHKKTRRRLIKIILIAAFGFSGAVARHLVQDASFSLPPVCNTLLINVAGSFLLTFLLGMGAGWTGWRADLRLGLATGFLGAFTTFSGMCREIVELGWLYGSLLGVGMLMFGLLAAAGGALAARALRKGGAQ